MRKGKLHNAKRLLSMLLALLMAVTLLPIAAFASGDYSGHWAETSIGRAVEMGWFADGNNTRPNASITRAEFVTMVNRMKGYSGQADLSGFTDIKESDWYYGAFSAAVAQGYVQGSDGRLNPTANITRNEAVTIFVRISGLDTTAEYLSALASVRDAAAIPDWAMPYAGAAVRAGLIAGSDGNFNGGNNISRAETAVLLERLYDDIRMYGFAGTYTGSANGVVVAAPDITLQNYSIAGDLTIAASVGDGTVNLNNISVGGKLDVHGGGMNSVYISNSDIASIVVTKDEVRVVFSDGTTASYANVVGEGSRIVVEGGAKIESIVVEGDAAGANIVVEEGAEVGSVAVGADNAAVNIAGTVGEVTVNANNATLDVAGTVGGVTVNADNATIEVAGTITEVKVNANNASISGSGKVEAVAVESGSGTSVKTEGAKVAVSEGAGTVTTGDNTAINPGTSGDSKPDTSTSTGGGGGGGGGGSSGGSSSGSGGGGGYVPVEPTAKSDGSEVTGSLAVDDPSKTSTAITVTGTVTLVTATGQSIEYAIGTSGTTPPTTGWQDGLTFTGLLPGTAYFVWARSAENSSYNAGTASCVSAAITTLTGAHTVTVDDITDTTSPTGTAITVNFTVKDTGGNTDTSFTGTKNVTVTGYAQAPDTTFGSFNSVALNASTQTVSVTFSGGTASVPLILHKADTAQTITFDVTGVDTQRASGTVSITPVAGAVDSLELTTPAVVPKKDTNDAVPLTTMPEITLLDEYKNVCATGTSATATVELSASVATGDAPTLANNTKAAVNGVATFSGTTIQADADVASFSLIYTADGKTVAQTAKYINTDVFSVSISPSSGTWSAEYGYTNTEKTQTFTVTNTGNAAFTDLNVALANGTSFTITENTVPVSLAVGVSATVTVKPNASLGVNNGMAYTDTLKVTSSTNSIANKDAPISFTVTPKPITGATFGAIAAQNYTGSAITPDVATINLSGTTLTKDTHYTLGYENNTAAGTATIVATGVGNYTGTATTTFTINAVPVSTLTKGTVTSSTAAFTWSPAVGATSVELHVSTSSGGPFAKAIYASELSADSTSVTATNLSPSTNYWFKLVVVGGSFAGDSNVEDLTTDTDIINVTSSAYTTTAGQNIVTITLTGGIFKEGAISYSDFTFVGDNAALFASATYTRTSNTVVTVTGLNQLGAASNNTVTVKAATLTKKADSVAAVSSALYTISGKILPGTLKDPHNDQQSISVAGLTVQLYDSAGTSLNKSSGASDAQGNYTIYDVVPKTDAASGYKVMVSGYPATMSNDAFAVANNVTGKDITLSLGTLKDPGTLALSDVGVASWTEVTQDTLNASVSGTVTYTVELWKNDSTKIDITNPTTTSTSMNLLENMHGGGEGTYTFKVTASAPGYVSSAQVTSGDPKQTIAVLETPASVTYSSSSVSWGTVTGVDYYVVKLYKAAYAAEGNNSASSTHIKTYPNVAGNITTLTIPAADIASAGNYYVTVQAMAKITSGKEATLYKDGVESGKAEVAKVSGAVTMNVAKTGTGGAMSVTVGANSVNPNDPVSILASATMSDTTGYVLDSVTLNYKSNTWTYTYTPSNGNWVRSGAVEGFDVTITPTWEGKKITFTVPADATNLTGITLTANFTTATAIEWKLSGDATALNAATGLVNAALENVEWVQANAASPNGTIYFILPGDRTTHNKVTIQDSSRDNLRYEITNVTGASAYTLTAVPKTYAHLKTALDEAATSISKRPGTIKLDNDFTGATGNFIALTSDNAPGARNLVIDGSGKTVNFGILITDASNVTVKNLNIDISDATRPAGLAMSNTLGAALFVEAGGNNNKLVDCTIKHSTTAGDGVDTDTVGQAAYIAGPISIEGGSITVSGRGMSYAVLIAKSIATVSIKNATISGWTPLFIASEAATNFASLVPANFTGNTITKSASAETAAVIVHGAPNSTLSKPTDSTASNAISNGALSTTYFTTAAINILNALRASNTPIDFMIGNDQGGVKVQLKYENSMWTCTEYTTNAGNITITPQSAKYYAGNGVLVITMDNDMTAAMASINLGLGDNQIRLADDTRTPNRMEYGLGMSGTGAAGNYYTKADGFAACVGAEDASVGKWYWSGTTLVINIGRISNNSVGISGNSDALIFNNNGTAYKSENWTSAKVLFNTWFTAPGYNDGSYATAHSIDLTYDANSYSTT